MNDDSCPICLESMEEEDTLKMPVCGHMCHVRCALENAQYDLRCSLCRAIDPKIRYRSTHFESIDVTFEEIDNWSARRQQMRRRYQNRKSHAISKDKTLRKLRDRLNDQSKSLSQNEQSLQSLWVNEQKNVWKSHPEIQALRKERNLLMNRVRCTKKKFSALLDARIGPEPDLF